jgi:hypothetical protein
LPFDQLSDTDIKSSLPISVRYGVARVLCWRLATSMPREAHTSIWFFIGLLLTIYGVLILGASLHDLAVPPEHSVVLANLHAGIWWGVLLIVLGLIYTLVFAPWRKKNAR